MRIGESNLKKKKEKGCLPCFEVETYKEEPVHYPPKKKIINKYKEEPVQNPQLEKVCLDMFFFLSFHPSFFSPFRLATCVFTFLDLNHS